MSAKIRFGVYELDRDALELRKHGVPIRLQEQPFRVLAMLAERPGEIITREELQQQIWGNTFVDFDQSLNKAVNRVREALNDNAGTPQYVETIPRRGYRFIAPVAATPLMETPSHAAPVSTVPVEVPTSSRPRRSPFRIVLIAGLAVAGLLAVLSIATFLWWKQPKKQTLPEARLVTSFGYSPAVSRDGKLLAYGSGLGGGKSHIWVQQTAGGEAVPVTTGAYSGDQPDFSPDGTRIVFQSGKDGGGIYVTSTLPGEPRLVIATATAERPRFSPGGDRILYWQDGKAFTVAVDGGQPVALPLDQEFRMYSDPLWSPDGTEILFYGVRNRELNKPAEWWIATLAPGQARLAHLPGVEANLDPANVVIAWSRAADGREWIIYGVTNRQNWKIWRVGIAPRGAIDRSPELLISGNGWLGPGGSASEDGKLTYNLWSFSASIYQVSINDRGQKLGATVELPLPEGAAHLAPSLSRDGKWMAYDTSAPSKPRVILLRDLSTGKEHLVDDKGRQPGSYPATSISPDGARVIFQRDCKEGIFPERNDTFPCSYRVSSAGGEPERLCVGCTPRGFSADGSLVLFQKYDQVDPTKDRIVSVDLRTKAEQDFLRDPSGSLYHPFFSWDDRWVVFKRIRSMNLPQDSSELLIAPVRNGMAAPQAKWIPVTDGQHSDDKPQFSADGNTIYFTSNRDGYLCIWAQRLDPATKHPVGPPVGFEHFHNSSGHLGASYQAGADLSVARDKILINLPQQHSDIWMTQMP